YANQAASQLKMQLIQVLHKLLKSTLAERKLNNSVDGNYTLLKKYLETLGIHLISIIKPLFKVKVKTVMSRLLRLIHMLMSLRRNLFLCLMQEIRILECL